MMSDVDVERLARARRVESYSKNESGGLPDREIVEWFEAQRGTRHGSLTCEGQAGDVYDVATLERSLQREGTDVSNSVRDFLNRHASDIIIVWR